MERIDRLETKVREMIAMVHSLKEENGRLKSQVAEYENRLSGLSAEQGVIDEERNRLRDRIESMLADLEALESAAESASASPPEDTAPEAEPAPETDTGEPTPESGTGPFTGNPYGEDISAGNPAEPAADAGAQAFSLPEPGEGSDDAPEGFEPRAEATAVASRDDDDAEPPARPGSDPAHPVLPGFS